MSKVQADITVQPVNADNWRDITKLTVSENQKRFVAEPAYYLALCCYDTWNPLAIYLGEEIIGFMMWGIDDDKSCWLGGILIDQKFQNKGYGRQAVTAAMSLLAEQASESGFALSYELDNTIARHLYTSMGFVETDETEGDEIVARLKSV